jgi:hypothetical protein
MLKRREGKEGRVGTLGYHSGDCGDIVPAVGLAKEKEVLGRILREFLKETQKEGLQLDISSDQGRKGNLCGETDLHFGGHSGFVVDVERICVGKARA